MIQAFLNAVLVLCFLYAFPCLAQILTLEEKVGQLMMVHFNGESANEDARTLIQDVKVGGIIYYVWANELGSPEQVQSLSWGLQKLAEKNRLPIPLFIAIDHEGGGVARLNRGFTTFPGNRALGETHDPDLAEASAFAMGEELNAVGINLNFAPVVDINLNPYNPIIGIRSFGDDPETVSTFAKRALLGWKQAGILAALKHFPGHGDVEIDSHSDLPFVSKTLEELQKVELFPFAKLAGSAEVIMTAHLLVPALDQEHCTTLSEKSLDYLKNHLGFKGLIVTDSLVMESVLKKCHSIDEAAIQAFNAGCDLLLLGGKLLVGGQSHSELNVSDVKRIHRSMIDAVKSGRISETKLNASIEKILLLKERHLADAFSKSRPCLNQLVNHPSYQAIAQKIACKALKISPSNGSIDIRALRQKNVFFCCPEILRDNVESTTLLSIGATTHPWYFNLNPTSEDIKAAKQVAANADVLILCSYNAWKSPSQIALIESLLDSKKPCVLVVTRDPIDSTFFATPDLIIHTFSPTTPSLQALNDQINTY